MDPYRDKSTGHESNRFPVIGNDVFPEDTRKGNEEGRERHQDLYDNPGINI